jgi:uncharacterized protein DUF6600
VKVKKLLLGTLTASGVMVLAAAGQPAFFPIVTKAEAAVNVSIEIGFDVFYDRLADDGDWVTLRDRYVWVPNVAVGWRPYLHGHWIYTRTYGWYWISDEPFAWAVYHYGRWTFDPEIGWYWVPGRRWAPAWVAWSHTDDEIAWAPLPPDYDDDVSVSISIGSVPAYYWHAVPVAFFVSVDLEHHVIHDRDHVHRIVSNGQPQTVMVRNNTVVNDVIDVDQVRKKSKEKVVVYEEKPADKPEAAGAAQGNAVAVFNPEVKEKPEAKPAKLKKVEEVAAKKKASGTLPKESAETTTPAGATEQPSTEAAVPSVKGAKPKAEETGAEKKAGTEKKKQPAGEAAQQPESAQGQAATDEQPVKKKKKAVEEQKATGDQQQVEQPKSRKQQQAEEPVKKQKTSEKALKAQTEATSEEAAPATQGKKAQKPEKKREKKQCDPAVEDCSAQQ